MADPGADPGFTPALMPDQAIGAAVSVNEVNGSRSRVWRAVFAHRSATTMAEVPIDPRDENSPANEALLFWPIQPVDISQLILVDDLIEQIFDFIFLSLV
jgi:hypothetical protein